MTITRASWILVAAAGILGGCATKVPATEVANAGLANAPKLGTYPAPGKPYDVIADGVESCEHAPDEKAPLWSRSPPCEASVEATPTLPRGPVAAPPPAWVPRSRWSLPACAKVPRREPVLVASCCPEGDLACMQ